MNKEPYMYNDKQFEEVEKFVEEKFGSHYDYIVHEIESEYVHTDIFVVKSRSGEKQFITCGMGAREMSAPNKFKRCELVMMASNRFVITREEGMTLATELVGISKFPFREETWIGTIHTINASEEFKEMFGYDYFVFVRMPQSTKLTGIDDDINFLMMVPIYEEEREWCVENHTLAFLEKLHEKYDGKELYADFKREVFIPDDLKKDELYDYIVMTALGIDKPTLKRLTEYLGQQAENGVEATYEMIEKWVSENN